MADLLQELIHNAAVRSPEQTALVAKRRRLSYRELSESVTRVGAGLAAAGIRRRDRVAVFLPKQVETVEAIFGVFQAGAIAIPVNPVLKAAQVGHILRDAGARALVTSKDRYAALAEDIAAFTDLEIVILVGDAEPSAEPPDGLNVLPWQQLLE